MLTNDDRFKLFLYLSIVTAIHLERNVSFSVTGSNGIINRWHPQWLPSGIDSFLLEDHNSSLVIPSTGLYLIYAQVHKTAIFYIFIN